MIHILRRGSPVCGLAPNPREWPAGVSWVREEDAHKATCTNCLEWLEWESLPTLQLAPEDIYHAEIKAHGPKLRLVSKAAPLPPDGDDD